MNTCRAITSFVIFSLQLGSANAQLGDLDMGIIKAIKSLRKKDPIESAQSNTTSQRPATDSPEKKPHDVPPKGNIPPVFEAAKNCANIEFSKLLKEDPASINKVLCDMAWSGKSDDIIEHPFAEYTLLAIAAQNGCTNVVKQLLEAGVDLDAEGVSPLGVAVQSGRLQIVKMLLEAGADGRGLLKLSVAKDRLEILQTLLKLKTSHKNVDEHGYSQRPEFWDAIEKGNLDLIKAFVVEREDISEDRVNYYPKLGPQTLTQIAFKANKPEIIEYLKEARVAQLDDKNRQRALAAQKLAAQSDALDKQLQEAFDHPDDVYGLAKTRYRIFDGKTYDCVEPITLLNKTRAFNSTFDRYPQQKSFLRKAAETLRTNEWVNAIGENAICAVLVKQVVGDGLVVRLNSRVEDEVLVFLKNHPKQEKYVDGEAITSPYMFALKTKRYQSHELIALVRTIPGYDFGVVVPQPSEPPPKLPVPANTD